RTVFKFGMSRARKSAESHLLEGDEASECDLFTQVLECLENHHEIQMDIPKNAERRQHFLVG
ncbi:hypothetical protein KIN20_015854, partial [Parelaphostrongylus tenuis]